MRTEIDAANIEPEDFATQIARWLELLGRRGKPTPEMREASVAASDALGAAARLNRQPLFQKLAEGCGIAAMEFAAQEGLSDVVRQLAAVGVDVNGSSKSSCDKTPLIFAAKKGHAATVEALLDCGADPAVNVMGMTALSTAIYEGQRESADVLLSRCDDLSSMEGMCDTLLELVARYNRPEYVEALVSRGVPPDGPDNVNVTPLAVAAGEGNAEVVEAFLKAGASTELPPPAPDAKQRDLLFRLKDTPLILAAKNGHESVVRMLIAAGAHA